MRHPVEKGGVHFGVYSSFAVGGHCTQKLMWHDWSILGQGFNRPIRIALDLGPYMKL